MSKFFAMGRDYRTGEYVPIAQARKNPDRYEVIKIDKETRAIRRSIYEPKHEKGGICWCRPIFEKREDNRLHISHRAQRDTITDAIRNLRKV